MLEWSKVLELGPLWLFGSSRRRLQGGSHSKEEDGECCSGCVVLVYYSFDPLHMLLFKSG